MYTCLSVCVASHNELVESLIRGNTAWRANRDKAFERALDLHHAIQITDMGVYYNTHVSIDEAAGLSYEELEQVCDGMHIYMEDAEPGSVEFSKRLDAVFLSAAKEDRKTDDEREKFGMRRYRRKPDDAPTKKAEARQQQMVQEILEPALRKWGRTHKKWQSHRPWGVPEIGRAKSVAQRANAHVFTALSCALFESDGVKRMKIQQYCLCQVINEEDKNLLEAMFSMLTGSYYFYLGLNPTLAGGIHELKSGKADDLAITRDRIIEEHFAANNIWVKERAQIGAVQDLKYVDERLEKLEWYYGTMRGDIEEMRAVLEKVLDKVKESTEKTVVLNLQLDLNDAERKVEELKLAFE